MKYCFSTFLLAILGLVLQSCGNPSPEGHQNHCSPEQNEIIQQFLQPDVDAKPMIRWWFPSADVDEQLVRKHLQDVYDAGFGGVEVALVPHYTSFDAGVDGWGTDKWKQLMKLILRTASELPSSFKVDFTITAHWPPALNTIDPNDVAASQEMAFVYQKAWAGNNLPLPLPETKTHDRDGTGFIFTDDFVAATVAQVESVEGDNITLAAGSLKDVSSYVSRIEDENGEDKFTKAGIPEDAQSFGNKPRLADKQYYYQINLQPEELDLPADSFGQGTADPNDEIESGDWLLFAYYRRGTGQSISGMGMMHLFLPMNDGMYATNYYNAEGTNAIIDYWNEHLLNDPELVALLKACKGDLFEDSIESFSMGAFWPSDLLEEFLQHRQYHLTPYLPFIACEKSSKAKFHSSDGNSDRFLADYHQTLNELYISEHVETLQNWTQSFGYGYRAQPYGASVETSGASAVLDVAEGESLGFGSRLDQFRNIAGGVHMADKKFVSDEVLADLGAAYKLTWGSSAKTLNNNFAAGVNRMIFHGTSYPVEPSGEWNDWPGWHPFQAAFAEPWDSRQTYWDDVHLIADFVARSQAVLQNGRSQMDLAVYKSQLDYGMGFEELLDQGFSYDIIGTSVLLHENARLEDGRLGPAQYKAVIVNDAKSLTIEAADKLMDLAGAGFPHTVLRFRPGNGGRCNK